jgi:hypothetical protein
MRQVTPGHCDQPEPRARPTLFPAKTVGFPPRGGDSALKPQPEWIARLSALLLLSTVTLSAIAGEAPYWTTLTYRAAGALGEITVQIDLEPLGAKKRRSWLLGLPEGKTAADIPPPLLSMRINRSGRSPFTPDRSSERELWFSQRDAAAFQLIKLRRDPKPEIKTYRFARNGVYRLRARPGSDEKADAPPNTWSNTKTSFYPYAESMQAQCARTLDPAALIFVLGRPDAETLIATTCLFFDDRLHRLKLDRLLPGEDDGTTELIRLDTQRNSAESTGTLELFGLRGPVTLLLDKARGIPLSVSGRANRIGDVELKLQRATMGDGSTWTP